MLYVWVIMKNKFIYRCYHCKYFSGNLSRWYGKKGSLYRAYGHCNFYRPRILVKKKQKSCRDFLLIFRDYG